MSGEQKSTEAHVEPIAFAHHLMLPICAAHVGDYQVVSSLIEGVLDRHFSAYFTGEALKALSGRPYFDKNQIRGLGLEIPFVSEVCSILLRRAVSDCGLSVRYVLSLNDHEADSRVRVSFREHIDSAFPELKTRDEAIRLFASRVNKFIKSLFQIITGSLPTELAKKLVELVRRHLKNMVSFYLESVLSEALDLEARQPMPRQMIPQSTFKEPDFLAALVSYFRPRPPKFWHNTDNTSFMGGALKPLCQMIKEGVREPLPSQYEFSHRGLDRKRYIFFSGYYGSKYPTDPSPLHTANSVQIKSISLPFALRHALFFPYRDRVVEINQHWGSIPFFGCLISMKSIYDPEHGALGVVEFRITYGDQHEVVIEDNRSLAKGYDHFSYWMASRVEAIVSAVWRCFAKADGIEAANAKLNTDTPRKAFNALVSLVVCELLPPMMVCVPHAIDLSKLLQEYFIHSAIMPTPLAAGDMGQIRAYRHFAYRYFNQSTGVSDHVEMLIHHMRRIIDSGDSVQLLSLLYDPRYQLGKYSNSTLLPPGHLYFYINEIEAWGTALHYAVLKRDAAFVKELVDTLKLDMNACVMPNHKFVYLYGRHTGPTAISYALGKPDMMKVLLSKGANPFHETARHEGMSYALLSQLHTYSEAARRAFLDRDDFVVHQLKRVLAPCEKEVSLPEQLATFHLLDKLACAFTEFKLNTQLSVSNENALCLNIDLPKTSSAGSACLHPFQKRRLSELSGVDYDSNSNLFNMASAKVLISEVLGKILTAMCIDALNDRCERLFFTAPAAENREGGSAYSSDHPPILTMPYELDLRWLTYIIEHVSYDDHQIMFGLKAYSVGSLSNKDASLTPHFEARIEQLGTLAKQKGLEPEELLGKIPSLDEFNKITMQELCENLKHLGFDFTVAGRRVRLALSPLALAEEYTHKNPYFRGEFDVFWGSKVAVSGYTLRETAPKLTTSGGHFNRPGAPSDVMMRQDEEFAGMPNGHELDILETPDDEGTLFEGTHPVETIKLGDHKSQLLFRMHFQLNLPTCEPDQYEYKGGKVEFKSVLDIKSGTQVRAFWHNGQLTSPFKMVFAYLSTSLSELLHQEITVLYDVETVAFDNAHQTKANFGHFKVGGHIYSGVDPFSLYTLLKYPDYFAEVRQHLLDKIFGDHEGRSRVCWDELAQAYDDADYPSYLNYVDTPEKIHKIAQSSLELSTIDDYLVQVIFLKKLQSCLLPHTAQGFFSKAVPNILSDEALLLSKDRSSLWERVPISKSYFDSHQAFIQIAITMAEHLKLKVVRHHLSDQLYRRRHPNLIIMPPFFRMPYVKLAAVNKVEGLKDPELLSIKEVERLEDASAAMGMMGVSIDHWIFKDAMYLFNWIIRNDGMPIAYDEFTQERVVYEIKPDFSRPFVSFESLGWSGPQIIRFKEIYQTQVRPQLQKMVDQFEFSDSYNEALEMILAQIKDLERSLRCHRVLVINKSAKLAAGIGTGAGAGATPGSSIKKIPQAIREDKFRTFQKVTTEYARAVGLTERCWGMRSETDGRVYALVDGHHSFWKGLNAAHSYDLNTLWVGLRSLCFTGYSGSKMPFERGPLGWAYSVMMYKLQVFVLDFMLEQITDPHSHAQCLDVFQSLEFKKGLLRLDVQDFFKHVTTVIDQYRSGNELIVLGQACYELDPDDFDVDFDGVKRFLTYFSEVSKGYTIPLDLIDKIERFILKLPEVLPADPEDTLGHKLFQLRELFHAFTKIYDYKVSLGDNRFSKKISPKKILENQKASLTASVLEVLRSPDKLLIWVPKWETFKSPPSSHRGCKVITLLPMQVESVANFILKFDSLKGQAAKFGLSVQYRSEMTYVPHILDEIRHNIYLGIKKIGLDLSNYHLSGVLGYKRFKDATEEIVAKLRWANGFMEKRVLVLDYFAVFEQAILITTFSMSKTKREAFFKPEDLKNLIALKQAFVKLARQYHPDKAGGDSVAALKMRDLNEAYQSAKQMLMGNKQRDLASHHGPMGGAGAGAGVGAGSTVFKGVALKPVNARFTAQIGRVIH